MNKCPCCDSRNSESIQVHDGNLDQNIFAVRFVGRIELRVCCDCGTVFVDNYHLNKLKEVKTEQGKEGD